MKTSSAMRTRELSEIESSNLQVLNAAGIESVPLFLTKTGFDKSICDATSVMRDFFRLDGFHDYALQSQGQENKILRTVKVMTGDGFSERNISLYRPTTKNGDPRFWVTGLRQEASADNVLAFFRTKGIIHIVNLSSAKFKSEAMLEFLSEHGLEFESNAQELLKKLREIAKYPIKASGKGDTFIGRDIEARLGIRMNSSPEPDYKGIELKSKRISSVTRSGLFCAVPDWDLGCVKDFDDLLNIAGYQSKSGEDFRLYCTVSAKKENSQGLILTLDEVDRLLWENRRTDSGSERLVAWSLPNLENRLKNKHRETFWLKVDTFTSSGHEWFRLKTATHTRTPNVPQFSRMLAVGDITVDHLIKKPYSTGRVHEKGPQFKVAPKKRDELFLGKTVTYELS